MPFPLRPRRVPRLRPSASEQLVQVPRRPVAFVDILPAALERAGLDCTRRRRPLPETLRLWSLVLEARDVEYRLRESPAGVCGWVLEVLEPTAHRALAEILSFEKENLGRRMAPQTLPSPWAVLGALAVILGLVCFHGLTAGAMDSGRCSLGLPAEHADWVRLGAADARLMVYFGEWWRAATALTLHADTEHLGGNACLGGLFLVLAGRELGLGVALCLAIVSGVLGNAANALLYRDMHVSLGASTAVFGLLGALTMHRSLALFSLDAQHRAAERPGLAWARVFAPLAAGIFMLALFGAGSQGPQGQLDPVERTDVLAHLFGFLAGVGLGWILHKCEAWSRRAGVGLALGWGSLALLSAAWWMALR